jgi:hypothetical protein
VEPDPPLGGHYHPFVRRLTERWAGWLLIGCAIVATVAVAWPPDRFKYRPGQSRVYGVETGWVVALLWAGVVVVAIAPAMFRCVGAAVTAVAALQLAGTGVVAWRRWFTSGGIINPALNQSTLRALAIVLSVAAVVMVAMSVAVLVDAGAVELRRRAGKAVPVVVIGVAVAIGVPLAMGWEAGNRTTQGGAHALMYGLPWGMAIAGSVFLRYRERLATISAVALSAATLLFAKPMIHANNERLGFVVVMIALLLTMPMRGQAPTLASRRSSGRSGVGGASA